MSVPLVSQLRETLRTRELEKMGCQPAGAGAGVVGGSMGSKMRIMYPEFITCQASSLFLLKVSFTEGMPKCSTSRFDLGTSFNRG